MSDTGKLTSSEIVLYQGEDGRSRIQVRLDDGTVWLTQVLLADLFQTTKQNISLHIKNIFEEGELDPSATVKQYLTVQTEGQREVRRSKSCLGRANEMKRHECKAAKQDSDQPLLDHAENEDADETDDE